MKMTVKEAIDKAKEFSKLSSVLEELIKSYEEKPGSNEDLLRTLRNTHEIASESSIRFWDALLNTEVDLSLGDEGITV